MRDLLLRRSCLTVPASSQSKLRRALTVSADEVILDLEDAVLPESKTTARAAVLECLADWPASAPTPAVRINAPRTPWCHTDILALVTARARPSSIVIPKVQDAGDMAFIDRLLDGAEGSREAAPIRVQALIEDVRGLSHVGEIAASSERLDALIIGYADLAVSLGRTPAAASDMTVWDAARNLVLVAARSNGLDAIDGPYLGIDVDDGFLNAAARAKAFGFDGKWLVHPSQIEQTNEIFSPTYEEVCHAERIVEQLRAASETGQGAAALDGQMLDRAVQLAALSTLARRDFVQKSGQRPGE